MNGKTSPRLPKSLIIVLVFIAILVTILTRYLSSQLVLGSEKSDFSQQTKETTREPAALTQGPDQIDVPLTTFSPIPLTTYLENPGIGLQYDQTVSNPIVGETVAYLQREDISWNIVNPEENVYRWDVIDTRIEQAVNQGKQASFRIYTMRGENYGGHRVPQWVLDKGATLFSTGDPNYHNCTYQEEWGFFVNQLVERYDGNPNIAYIDISGYGAFNEWNWNDTFTEWDFEWEKAYNIGEPDPSIMSILDSQSWRRLIDTFVGGAFESHECVDQNGTIQSVGYSYPGFKRTQLVMPYAGIRQATQYMVSKGLDIGFRYDCLGSDGSIKLMEKLGSEINMIWPKAPVIFEYCDPANHSVNSDVLRATHASLVHSNKYVWEEQQLVHTQLLEVGYKYRLLNFTYAPKIAKGAPWSVEMTWENSGYAPNYPKMGQEFVPYIQLSSADEGVVTDLRLDIDINEWMPADPIGTQPPTYKYSMELQLPSEVPAGKYIVSIMILDTRTRLPIHLAIEGRTDSGAYTIGSLDVE